MRIYLKIIMFTAILCVVLFILSVIGFTTVKHSEVITQFSAIISNHKICFIIWRYFLFILIIYFYPYFVSYVFRKGCVVETAKIQKYSRRRYVIIALILIEIFVIRNGLAWIVTKLINL